MSLFSGDVWFGTSGPRDARVIIVGEAWGYEENLKQRPFVGQSGQELERMLAEAGLPMSSCFLTNVVPARPDGNEMWKFFYPAKESPVPALRGLHPTPIILKGLEHLYEQIRLTRPKVILALGNYALWALTDCTSFSTTQESEGRRCPSGIMQWRGSLWYSDVGDPRLSRLPLVPAIHPAAILRAWYNRAPTVQDFRQRVVRQGLLEDWRPLHQRMVLAPPNFLQAKETLENFIETATSSTSPFRLVNDIETARSLITCIGFASSEKFSISIPFIRTKAGQPFENYWTHSEEMLLIKLMRTLLTHKNVEIEGQNYLYDTQYIQKFLQCTPRIGFDSMLAQHLLFPGTPKALDYLSSLYCKYHWYWKEDHKEWDMRGTIEDLLIYNAEDCMRNFEINTTLRQMLLKMGMWEKWEEELEKNQLALEMMSRGTLIDKKHQGKLALDLSVAASELAIWFEKILPQSVVSPDSDPKKVASWFDSPTQQRRFFSQDLGLRLPINRKTGNETFGYEALSTLKERHPEFSRLFEAMETYRSLNVFHNTFVKAGTDHKSRMRCMFNVAGTETFRWSSSKDAFGSGTNLQNIPKGEED